MMRVLALCTWMVAAGIGCSHGQRPGGNQSYVITEDASGVGGSGGRNCDQEQVECFTACWSTPELPYPHVKRDEWYYKYCTKKCREEYVECVQEKEAVRKESARLRFSNMDAALDWLREHKKGLVIGTVVVVAGGSFVIATGGGGALLLVPIVL
ncbi:hypothetical protein OV208_21475 [Corallococcus sp. bb12-1]|uniref:hypothetical protein n=1 Tax=Corallococcus sp. bb12-1 TaxID=2996784 RepID=UPI0022719ADB|nr:hypothetical protein [Corallococcus sp. bb12-1]MCY1043902.1 hypothetical protein [Corallococcus sp. bb12-1]